MRQVYDFAYWFPGVKMNCLQSLVAQYFQTEKLYFILFQQLRHLLLLSYIKVSSKCRLVGSIITVAVLL